MRRLDGPPGTDSREPSTADGQRRFRPALEEFTLTPAPATPALPSVWHKVKVTPASERKTLTQKITSVSPLGGLWGIWKAIQSKEYMKHRKATWRTRP